MDKVAYSEEAHQNSIQVSEQNIKSGEEGCSWPLTQDANPLGDATTGNYNWAFWLTDDKTSDIEKEFDIALHFWEVRSSIPTAFTVDLANTFRSGVTALSLEAFGRLGSISSFRPIRRMSLALGRAAARQISLRPRA